jgi:hypothetical protein
MDITPEEQFFINIMADTNNVYDEMDHYTADYDADFDDFQNALQENANLEVNGWIIDEHGFYYYPYVVNGIRCVLWSGYPYYILEYGDNTYYVNEHYEVYENEIYVGALNNEGDIHR